MTDDLGKYLGVPILHKRVNQRSFHYILDKVDQRLSNWKAKTLSFVGRINLTQSVLQALSFYVMQSVYLPRHICDQMIRSVEELCGERWMVNEGRILLFGSVCALPRRGEVWA